MDDEKRHANVKVDGIKPVYERTRLGDPYLSFRVDYTTNEFESNASAITKKSADTDAPANLIAPDNQTGWKGNIIIEFGTRDNIPLLGKSIPAMRGLYHWKNKTERISVQQQGEWSPMTAGLTGEYGDAKKPGSADLFNFLKSCGRFTVEQVNDIFANIKDVKESKLLNLARATPGTPIGGDLNKFAELYGGAAEFDGNLTKGGWDLDPNTMILTQKFGN